MRRKRRKQLILLAAAMGLLGMLILGVRFEKRLSRVMAEMAVNAVKAKAGILISNAVFEELEQNGVTYDKLVSFEKDDAGQITALKTDSIEINRLKSRLSVVILEKLMEMDNAELAIPLGTLVGGGLFDGRGPLLHIRTLPTGSVRTEIENAISSAGINQSRHQIMLCVRADLSVITSFSSFRADIDTYICIAETVIVGKVPDSYTYIDTHEIPINYDM